ncbi:conserved unknown protein [Ectocarpus siliculosus]|uniref:Uncharacterized protein n=1 Tax=Ectocarpus siliculosus TaxID=2880 RepID=D7FT95_ECTSI|nr:conserved unknown protein [Ectocarpus siliculosus]|eukprot:CBJ31361.1 conserved unknown protein [Ectocarpus siliculosus]
MCFLARAGPSRCLDALIIALNQASGGEWYTSTMQLQLASLELCASCRSMHLLKLNVQHGTPTRLWRGTATTRETRSVKRRNVTRVPVVRARTVTWKLPGLALRNMTGDAWSEVTTFSLGPGFDDDLPRGIQWPEKLTLLGLGPGFNRSVEHLSLPASVRFLVFGASFNMPMDNFAWPPLLRVLVLGPSFSQPIHPGAFPESLQVLLFQGDFTHPVEGFVWPRSLLQLYVWGLLAQPLGRISWPASLQVLLFGHVRNESLDEVTWPESLRSHGAQEMNGPPL